MSSYVITVLLSAVLILLIRMTKKWHVKITGDSDLSSVQKFHLRPVPRIGGVVIFVTLTIMSLLETRLTVLQEVLLCATPIFIAGIVEDFTKKVSSTLRLIFAYLSGLVAFFYLDIHIDSFALGIFGALPQWISFFITVTFIAGVCNATNIIDGFNGLLLGYTVLAILSLYFIALSVGDTDLGYILMICIMAIIPLFAVNILGHIFTGDGGAYFIGFTISSLGLFLVNRHPEELSVWVIFSILIYPIFETIFSIYRKFFLRKGSPFQADRVHFHMLFHTRKVVSNLPKRSNNFKHFLTALFLWGLSSLPMVNACIFYNKPFVLIFGILLFISVYVVLYVRMVRFKSVRFKKVSGRVKSKTL